MKKPVPIYIHRLFHHLYASKLNKASPHQLIGQKNQMVFACLAQVKHWQ